MRPRKWVLFLAIFFFGLSCALLLVKRRFERNGNLETLLIDAVTSINKGSLSVEAVRIGFFSVYLHQVAMMFPSSPNRLSIRKIKIGLSFAKLLKHRGDMVRSINQIILIEPDVTLSSEYFSDTLSSSSGKKKRPEPSPFDLTGAGSPVNYLYIKKGAIHLVDDRGDTLELARKLAGQLLSFPNETSFSLAGNFGSSHRNVSFQGTLGWLQHRHHFSVRLSNAHLEQPIHFGNTTVISGSLNGAVECTFTKRFHLQDAELHGWLQLTDGNISFNNTLPTPLDSIVLRLSFENSDIYINTLSAQFRSIPIVARGTFSFQPTLSTRLHVSTGTIAAASLAGLLPDSLLALINHPFSATADLIWNQGEDPAFSATIDDFSMSQIPFSHLSVKGHLCKQRLFADSICAKSEYIAARMSGFTDIDSANGLYDFGFVLSTDSFPQSVPLSGSIRAIGTITGSRNEAPSISSRIYAHDFRYDHISMGDPQLVASLSGNRCTFRSVSVDSAFHVELNGSIDNIFSERPHAVFSGDIGSDPIKRQLMRIQNMPHVDSVHCRISGSGWINEFTSSMDLHLAMKHFNGTLQAHVDRNASDTGALVWDIASHDIRIRDVPVSFSGRGSLNDTCVIIDTLSASNGISGKATLHYSGESPRIEASLRYDTRIRELLRFFPCEPVINKGFIQGTTRLSGSLSQPVTRSNVHITDAGKDSLGGFAGEFIIVSKGSTYAILPTKITRNGQTILTLTDTVTNAGGHFHFSATFSNLTPRILLDNLIPEDINLATSLSGTLQSSEKGLPIILTLDAPVISYDTISLDSINAVASLSEKGIAVSRLTFRDAGRSNGTATLFIPWNMLGNGDSENDTLRGSLSIRGNLLATIEKNISSPIGGSGQGVADFTFYSTGGNLTFTRGRMTLPHGLLEVRPFVPDKVKNFTFSLTIDSTAGVHTDMSGTIRRKPIRIFSTHDIPSGYEPLMIGPLNFGMFQVETPKKGVDLHLPGFMAGKERGGIDFKGKKPFDNFTISGPLDHLKLTGTWYLRDLEFTFPFLKTGELAMKIDPFPYVSWEMEVKAGNRRVMYYWDLATKGNRFLRFVEGYLDLSSIVKLSGRDQDKTFRVDGIIRSYKGAAYYGRVFDRYFDVGVEFNPVKSDNHRGYNNLPLLWGSAETFADTSRHGRVKLTCMVVDPTTSAMSEKGRLADQLMPNISFHLSSDFEELPDQQERKMYQEAGVTISSIGGAGSAVSDFGEQMFHRYLLQRWERRIAKKLGLDVINIETSIVSNYFNKLYSRQFNGLLNEDDYLALANVGVTVGRYFFRDFLFLKARGELIPIDMTLTPEYSIGFEFQPSRFIIMDINYGFHKTETVIQHSPLLLMQLRLPIVRVRNLFNF